MSATERATGLQKQLTIDNAVTRFRARNRQEALARVEATFFGGVKPAEPAQTVARAAPAAADGLPAEMAELIDRCQRLVAKSEELAGQSNPADAEQMRQHVREIREAITRRSQPDMEAAAERLEDLVFYLQDA